MATKYQCEKAIEQLVEKGSDDPNVQGYGIGRAKDYGLDEKVGYVVLVYTETAPKKITPAEEIKAGAEEQPDTASAPIPKAAKSEAKKTASQKKLKKKVSGAGKKGLRKTAQKKLSRKTSVKPEPKLKTKPAEGTALDKKVKTAAKVEADVAPAEPLYPDKVETTSRKKKVQVPLEYIETGKFGFS